MRPVAVAALYKFASVSDPPGLREILLEACARLRILGTLLVAAEGINGTICGDEESIEAFLSVLRRQPDFADVEVKFSCAAVPPFHRLKVRLKPEIVTLGDPEADPRLRVGTYVEPEDWNTLVDDPEVVVVDTRNDYEVRIGTFEGAIDPELDNFREFPQWAAQHLDPTRHRKVAMFCTGGIRCEKASSLLLSRGFEEVFHLRGGILRYLERVPRSASKWRGECFVFDSRVALDHDLARGTHELCYGCQEPVSPEDMRSPLYEAGVCCARCHAEVDEPTRAARRERARQVELASDRGQRHVGATMPKPSRRNPTPDR